MERPASRARRGLAAGGVLALVTGVMILSAGSAHAAVGDITEYIIPENNNIPSTPLGITAGPDGNLWFTEQNGNVVKVTTSGVFTKYLAPSSTGEGITAGPDGNLWFTESVGKVGKVTTSGVFTEYTIPTANSYPVGIAAGPDGNLWFIERNANHVAKVTTSGAFTEYPIPTAASCVPFGCVPYGIAAGPDGNLWFTEENGNKVAKVTTAGVFTEYPVPTPSGDPLFITGSAERRLGYAGKSGGEVGEDTTRGAFP